MKLNFRTLERVTSGTDAFISSGGQYDGLTAHLHVRLEPITALRLLSGLVPDRRHSANPPTVLPYLYLWLHGIYPLLSLSPSLRVSLSVSLLSRQS